LVGFQLAGIYRFIDKKGLFFGAGMRQGRCTKVHIQVSMEGVGEGKVSVGVLKEWGIGEMVYWSI
jgi:hypothetical protein